MQRRVLSWDLRLRSDRGASCAAARLCSDRHDTIILFRPVGSKELELIRASGNRAFPPRLPEQPIFYPVLTEGYAVQIARDWNVKDSGAGYVTRFRVRKEIRRWPSGNVISRKAIR